MSDYELPDSAIAEGNPAETEEIKENYFAPGSSAKHSYGVLYQGNWETPFDGTAVAVRKHACALAAAGVPVILKTLDNVVISRQGIPEPVPAVGIPEEVAREVKGLNLTSVGSVFPMVKHLVVSDALRLTQTLLRGVTGPSDAAEYRVGAQQAAFRSTILYSVWERNHVHPDIALRMSALGECWVPCEQNKKMLEAAGVQRVRVVPHPYSPDEDVCKLVRRPPLGDGAPKAFYSIGAWQPRKGFAKLIRAFLTHFPPDGKATLTIKYSGGSWSGYPSPTDAVRSALAFEKARELGWNSENVEKYLRLVTGRIPRSRVVELHLRHNIYVCASHGEAWCLPAFDAKLAGNRMVTVPYGGTADFSGEGDRLVAYNMSPVHSSYNWEPEAEWADYADDDLGASMLAAHPPERFERPPDYEARFSAAAVGRLMRERVIAMARELHPKAAAYYESFSVPSES